MTLPTRFVCLLLPAVLLACTSSEVSPAIASLDSTSLAFGDTPLESDVVRTVVLTNTGDDPLSLFSVTLVEGDSRVFIVAGPGAVDVLGGQSVDIDVTFEPDALGEVRGRLQIRTSDSVSGPLSVAVSGTGTPSIADNDEDGVTGADGDCDDGRADVFPGAPELCDGRDNDCDGDVPASEMDADNDGFRLCDADCDDADDDVFPGAPEICDGKDSDCDGDNPDDADGDSDGVSICDGDCDDNNSRSAPGLDEMCDGIDNDCDGGIDNLDADGDGHSLCGVVPDCNDDNASSHPSIVDPTAPDGGDGTVSSPFNVLAEGLADATRSCSFVYLAPGTHEASVSIDVPVTLVGDPAGGTEIVPPEGSRAFTVNVGTLTLRDLAIRGARSTADGGAVLVNDGGRLIAEHVVFEDNQSTGGDGGALSIQGTADSAVSSCLFVGNSASDDGGAVTVSGFSGLAVSNSTFENNRAADGGAIHADTGSVEVTASDFEGNVATGRGGGVFATGLELEVIRSTFVGNTAGDKAGGLFTSGALSGRIANTVFSHNSAPRGGAVASTATFDVEVANNTFIANTATTDGGMFFGSGDESTWVNNLALFNAGDSACHNDGPAPGFSITYSTIFSTVGDNWGLGCSEDASGNTTVNPLFVSVDDDPATVDDLSLQSGSPAIDSGDPDAAFDDVDGSQNDRGHTGGPDATP